MHELLLTLAQRREATLVAIRQIGADCQIQGGRAGVGENLVGFARLEAPVGPPDLITNTIQDRRATRGSRI